MSEPVASRRRAMPLWLWLPLALLVYGVIVATMREIADSLGWPDWTDTLISSGSFGLFYLLASRRVARAQKSFKERRRRRKARQP